MSARVASGSNTTTSTIAGCGEEEGEGKLAVQIKGLGVRGIIVYYSFL